MRKWIILPTLLLAATLFSCSQQSTAPDSLADTTVSSGQLPESVQQKVDQYVIQDEDNLVILDGSSSTDSTHRDFDVYAVTFLWGSFFPIGPGTGLSWNGHTGTNAEAYMRLVTAISFEDDQDAILDDSLPGIIAWRSFAHHDLDGISFLLFVKRGVTYIAAPRILFDAQPINFSIPVEDLAHHQSYHPVDASNGVAVFARKIRHLPCPHGHVGGGWMFDTNDRSQGTFKGRWFGPDNQTVGHITGTFWTTDDGKRLLAGEVSGVETDEVFIVFEGYWHHTPHFSNALCLACPSGGEFIARWKYLDGSGGGKVAGLFGDPTIAHDTPEVPFRGIWKQNCDHIVTDSDWSSITD